VIQPELWREPGGGRKGRAPESKRFLACPGRAGLHVHPVAVAPARPNASRESRPWLGRPGDSRAGHPGRDGGRIDLARLPPAVKGAAAFLRRRSPASSGPAGAASYRQGQARRARHLLRRKDRRRNRGGAGAQEGHWDAGCPQCARPPGPSSALPAVATPAERSGDREPTWPLPYLQHVGAGCPAGWRRS
jgi:hypothetical protein